jgi:hypothetical protein
MRKHALELMAVGMAASLVMMACNSGPTQNPGGAKLSSGSGSVVVLASDTPQCDVVSFKVTVTGATLSPQASSAAITTEPVTLVSSAAPVRVDFAALMDSSSILALADVPTGTYSQATITLSDPSMVYLDYSTSPPTPKSIVPALSTLTLTADINPALVVTSGSPVGLNLDLSLLDSVEIGEAGEVTGNVDPVFQLNPVTSTTANGFAELDTLHGVVASVTPAATTSTRVGSFTLQTLGGNGPTLTVNTTDSTVLDGVADLNSLLPSTFVEVNAIVDSGGDLVAREVDAEAQTDLSQGRAAFVGMITSVTRDAPPSANEFTLFVRESDPDVSTSVPPTMNHVVKISPTTLFGIAAGDVNRADLSFDASTLGAGQEVVVHGNFLGATPTSPATINANNVYLRLQSIVGNYSTLAAAGTDGKTGGFVFLPCPTLLSGRDFLALTFAETEFDGLADLNALDPAPTLIVKGLLFYEQSAGAVGDVAWTDPTLVFSAKRVRQLD